MVHALVYHPTREYSSASGWTSPRILDLVGKKVDFFVTRGGLVYYAGVYQLHDLRAVNPPGAPIPADMSASAIRLATRVVQAATADLDTAEIIREGFAGGEIRTECFALQCVAFDDPMYDSLRLRRRLNGESDSKRKAEESGKDASQGRLVRPRSP
ncbi:hypothetical protein DFH06DRAFT_529228 [Mycena polygramma]|nr:hypothetical protein DFH06DRAFT_529228 [Mycena polygramma]